MADPRQITELPVASTAEDANIILLRQGAFDKQVTVEKVRDPLLRKANNLSDLTDKAAARANLELSSMATVYIDAGSADTIEISGSGITAYSDKDNFWIRIKVDNTGAATLEVDSKGAKDIKTPDGSALAAGALEAEGVYLLVYDADGGGGSGVFVLTSSAHRHDDRYYTESEVDALLADKAESNFVTKQVLVADGSATTLTTVDASAYIGSDAQEVILEVERMGTTSFTAYFAVPSGVEIAHRVHESSSGWIVQVHIGVNSSGEFEYKLSIGTGHIKISLVGWR